MKKQLLETEKYLYKLLDDIYNIIPNKNINKAIYSSKKEQYEYQTSTFKSPSIYPCVMMYGTMKSNYSDYTKQHLYNKDYYFLIDVFYITLNDFKK